jgi:hypothetical protein
MHMVADLTKAPPQMQVTSHSSAHEASVSAVERHVCAHVERLLMSGHVVPSVGVAGVVVIVVVAVVVVVLSVVEVVSVVVVLSVVVALSVVVVVSVVVAVAVGVVVEAVVVGLEQVAFWRARTADALDGHLVMIHMVAD